MEEFGSVIIDPIQPTKPTDFVAGSSTGITAPILEENGQYDQYLPEDEVQSKGMFDTFCCVTFSALNDLETLMNRLIIRGELPATHLKFLKDNGYINPATGLVNFSDRFTGKMSGTTRKGNSLGAVGDSIRRDGLVPETAWPWPSDIEGVAVNDAIKIYFMEPPQDVKDLGKEFLKYFINPEGLYQWILVGTPNPLKLLNFLKKGPIQIAAKICSPWDSTTVPIKACGCGTEHATILYGNKPDSSWKLFDHYKGFRKLLASDYCIQYALQYYLDVLEVKEPKFKHTFLSQLTYGNDNEEVKNLQMALKEYGKFTKNVTGFFGDHTAAALLAFQIEEKILDEAYLRSLGGKHCGPVTRMRLNKLYGNTGVLSSLINGVQGLYQVC